MTEIDYPKTQKAKGIKALANYHTVPCFAIVGLDTDPSNLIGKFVRPCPMFPRHGFVDSRLVNTYEEAQAIIEETRKADPEAELLLMRPYTCDYSGIWTTGNLTIGKGNDGATSGTSALSIPTSGNPIEMYPELLTEAGITESPYVEFILPEGAISPYYVQLRNGPEIPQTIDYIPHEVKVTNVVLAEGDLLEWETKVKSFPLGTVVYHPKGALSSHYAVHSVLNRIPVMISRQPEMGETLRPTVESKPINHAELKAGFYLGCTINIDYKKAVYGMLAGLHHSVLWRGTHDRLIGFGMGLAYRLIVIAGIGEYRHHSRRSKKSRQTVYGELYHRILHPRTRARFTRAMQSFAYSDWQSGFGGNSWFLCCYPVAQMYNAILHDNLTLALEQFNIVINRCHNNGWVFNKFSGDAIMSEVANNPVKGLMPILRYIYSVMDYPSESIPKWYIGKRSYRKIDPDNETREGTPKPNPELMPKASAQFKYAMTSTGQPVIHLQYKLLEPLPFSNYHSKEFVVPLTLSTIVKTKFDTLNFDALSYGSHNYAYSPVVAIDGITLKLYNDSTCSIVLNFETGEINVY